jgi:drug/metabolite transporter (DMT)-like permease
MGAASDVFYGLAAAFGYGSGDFFARQAAHRIGHLQVLFYTYAISLAALLPTAILVEGRGWQPGLSWLGVLGLGVLNTFASLHLYRSFEYGVLSIVSPLISTYPAVTAALAIVLLREWPGIVATSGIVLALIGILSLSRSRPHPENPPPKDARKGLLSAFFAFAGYGVFYFALKYVVGAVGPVSTAALVRLVGVAILFFAGAGGMVRIGRPPRTVLPMLTVVGVLDVGGFVAYNVGISSGSVAIVGTLSGLFSAVTVGMAAILLRERLTQIQFGGILAILLGVVLIAIG